ncbi:hypothetical protein FACS189479_00980 [Spirochaetia bacterium]|nr:hypothetical protein FACS189479_00980 [Spirochaetia bacterium]
MNIKQQLLLLDNFSQNLFWDIDLADLDMEKHASYVIYKIGCGKILTNESFRKTADGT